MNIMALLLATAIPLLFLYIIYALDLYKTGAFRYVLACFISGGLAFATASFTNRYLITSGLLERDQVIRFAAPICEEVLKALILIYLVRRPNFTYFVDGAIYGFAAGMGFAVFENYQYIQATQNAGIAVAVGRVLSTNLIHASASAMVGVALGLSRFHRSAGRVGLLAAGLVMAAALHISFNNLVSSVQGGAILLYAALFGFGGAGFIAFAIKRGLAEEKTWIEETLGMTDRVTDSEARVVHRLADVQEILEPLGKRFGDEKAAQIEHFLTMQARLGIQRKTLEKLNDEKMRKAVEAQMVELRKEMDLARRAVGSYAMLYLRNIFPPDSSPLWGRLETLIQERAAARPASGGMNLWSALDQRTSQARTPSPFERINQPNPASASPAAADLPAPPEADSGGNGSPAAGDLPAWASKKASSPEP